MYILTVLTIMHLCTFLCKFEKPLTFKLETNKGFEIQKYFISIFYLHCRCTACT